MIRKRNLLRGLPVLSRHIRRLEALEAENRQLRGYLWESTTADVSRSKEEGLGEGGGQPVPPGILRYLVSGTDDLTWFLESGRLAMVCVTDSLARNGADVAAMRRILDFGCGCGRVLRHFGASFAGTLHGTDRNPVAIEWCRRHLPFAQFDVSPPEPPLTYADGTFDAIYAFSVFTHLEIDVQRAWMTEMNRLLSPGGWLLVSLHGSAFVRHLRRRERMSYREGRPAVLDEGVGGSNCCNVVHPEAYVRRSLAEGFEVVEFLPGGARGNPPQDLYVLRRGQPTPTSRTGGGASNGRGA